MADVNDPQDIHIPLSIHREILSAQFNGTEMAYILQLWHLTWFMR